MKLRILTLLSLTTCITFAPIAAKAEGLTYFEDPVYQMLSPGDHHPMEDMILYAQAGDTRAQFILGDMYAKGKGGFAKNETKAREWFEMAARNGENYSFIRLAALARHHKNFTEMYQWYTLAVDAMPYGSADRKWADAQREKLADDKKVTSDDIKTAKKAASDWKEKAKELLKADLELQKQKEPEAEALALKDNLEPEKKTEAAKAPVADKKPAEEKTAEAKPAETKPADIKSAETKTEDKKPSEGENKE